MLDNRHAVKPSTLHGRIATDGVVEQFSLADPVPALATVRNIIGDTRH